MTSRRPAELASDADRDRAAGLLRDHYAQGRLDLDEVDARIESVHRARTVGELQDALRDLPGDPSGPAIAVPASAEDQAQTALIVAIVAAVVPVPPVALGATAAWLGSRALRDGVVARRGQAWAAVAVGLAVAVLQSVLLVLWLSGSLSD